MAAHRILGILLAPFVLVGIASGQSYSLSEAPANGECFKLTLSTTLKGAMKVTRDEKPVSIKLEAKNEHCFFEKILAADKDVPRKSVRHYETAACTATVGTESVIRKLRDDRRQIVAQWAGDALLCYSPAGPLTHDELEVVAEHFDTLHLTGILPGKEVALGDSWKPSNETVLSLCLFEALIEHTLSAKLADVKDGIAVIHIDGKASGVELGAMVRLEVAATVKYDLLTKRITSLEWRQRDQRDQGPASPWSEVETVTTIQREHLASEPKELTKPAIAGVPEEDDPPGLLKQLVHVDAKQRFNLVYPRDWHIVGETPYHLILRLLDRGDFVAQATITPWKKAEKGSHLSTEEFKKLVSQAPGWEVEQILEEGAVPSDEGRSIYRITAQGNLDSLKVVQNFFLLADAEGNQVIVTITMKPANASKMGTRDVGLVNSIDFPKAK